MIKDLKQVNFQRPNIPQLTKEGYSCIDAHCHTNYSDGGKLADILKVCKKKGIGVAITDHNEIKGAVEALKQKDVFVVPGIELSSIEGPHILSYFYNVSELDDFHKKFIEPKRLVKPRFILKMSMIELMDKLENYNCATCLAHPYAPLWLNFNSALLKNPENREVIKRAHGIEVISGLQRKVSNIKARELQILFDKAPTAGSDAHSIKDLGNCITLARISNQNEFIDAIRKNRTIAIGQARIRQKARLATKILKKTIRLAIGK